jgi:protein ImuB
VLWRPGEHGGEGATAESLALVEQLRARLGRDGVYSLGLYADHRPERMIHSVEPAVSEALRGEVPWSATRRPLWLLAVPQALRERHALPVYDGALELVRGPERIETGWWDGAEVERDYYVACDGRRAWLWIFRERAAPHRWFLHGFFG